MISDLDSKFKKSQIEALRHTDIMNGICISGHRLISLFTGTSVMPPSHASQAMQEDALTLFFPYQGNQYITSHSPAFNPSLRETYTLLSIVDALPWITAHFPMILPLSLFPHSTGHLCIRVPPPRPAKHNQQPFIRTSALPQVHHPYVRSRRLLPAP